MPELPEVEKVVQGLKALTQDQPQILRIRLHRKDLRVPFPKGLAKVLAQQTLRSVQRRAKYILFETDDYFLINHLGMTGSWRSDKTQKKHDHYEMELSSGLRLVFNDPRRFGIMLLEKKANLSNNKWLKNLGVEPLDVHKFTAEYLWSGLRHRKTPIKSAIMDQHLVVGVGNIYASEVLYLAGVKPQRLAGQVTQVEAKGITEAIRKVLHQAIAHGGSTIRNYTNAEGKSGQFQDLLKVYERAGEACPRCGDKIKSAVIGGRSSYWCGRCQK